MLDSSRSITAKAGDTRVLSLSSFVPTFFVGAAVAVALAAALGPELLHCQVEADINPLLSHLLLWRSGSCDISLCFRAQQRQNLRLHLGLHGRHICPLQRLPHLQSRQPDWRRLQVLQAWMSSAWSCDCYRSVQTPLHT